jgi:hypothetical protein
VSSGEIRVLDAAVPDEVLGDAILVALARSRKSGSLTKPPDSAGSGSFSAA